MSANARASTSEGVITRPRGFRAAGVACGIKSEPGQLDLALLVSEVPAAVAGTFTSNSICSPTVVVSRERLRGGTLRGVVINAGNANACTGRGGLADAERMTELAAAALGLSTEQFAVASTGIIGHPLPMMKIEAGIASAAKALSDAPTAATDFARAICTTDRWPKESVRTLVIDGREVTIAGVAKGAGMISPKMATMLAFVTTDARIESEPLQELTTTAVNETFNRTSVDGDMSTNDTVLVLASGLAGNAPILPGSTEASTFGDALRDVCLDLAKSIVADGEGATKLVVVKVTGAASDSDADTAARQICNSLLVKTAMFGCDPNWGRIIAAAGSTDVRMSESRTTLRIGGEVIFQSGVPKPPSPAILAHMKTDAVDIELDLGMGDASAVMYACDLGHDYVTLNAEYHT